MPAPRTTRIDVSDVDLLDAEGSTARLGGGVQVLVLMRHRH